MYLSRLLHLIFNLYLNEDFTNDDKVPLFQLTKRVFSNLVSKDNTKARLPELVIHVQSRHALYQVT